MIKGFSLLLLTAMFTASCSHSYYIVRHAEKEVPAGNASMMSNDPALSEAGKVRALVLRDELKKKNIRYIFSTNTIRTISTATPLSQSENIAVQLYNTKDSLTQFIEELKKIKKGNVLVVGHSNTVDDIVNLLSNKPELKGDLSELQFDNLFIIKYKGKKVSFSRRKYGYPSNPE